MRIVQNISKNHRFLTPSEALWFWSKLCWLSVCFIRNTNHIGSFVSNSVSSVNLWIVVRKNPPRFCPCTLLLNQPLLSKRFYCVIAYKLLGIGKLSCPIVSSNRYGRNKISWTFKMFAFRLIGDEVKHCNSSFTSCGPKYVPPLRLLWFSAI